MLKQLKPFFSYSRLLMVLGVSSLLLTSTRGFAQSSTSHSPYSQFGLGQIREDLLPQTRAMGGISTGVRYVGGLPTLNIANPASYAALSRTILDAGLYGNITQLEKNSAKDHTADFAFSHITIAVPFGKAGGVSFGLMPFSDVGYNASVIRQFENTPYKSSLVGEGGVNKAYLGYGVSPIKGFSIGANVGFLFGNLYDKAMIEFPQAAGFYNTVQTSTREIRGASIDYGAQYFKALGNRLNFTIGYSGSLDNAIRNKTTSMVTLTQTNPNMTDGEQVAIDTTALNLVSNRDVNLPLRHNVGFTVSKGVNWMVGADFKYADWSKFQTREGEEKLGKNIGVAIGGQFKPDATSLKYLNVVDYRLGFRYNKSHITVDKQRLTDMAVTVGMGFPLSETNFGRTFSSINLSAEFGQHGTMKNNLIRERYINFNIGFTINDAWFIRRSYD